MERPFIFGAHWRAYSVLVPFVVWTRRRRGFEAPGDLLYEMECEHCHQTFMTQNRLEFHAPLCTAMHDPSKNLRDVKDQLANVKANYERALLEIAEVKRSLEVANAELTALRGRKTRFAFEPESVRFSRMRAEYDCRKLLDIDGPFVIKCCNVSFTGYITDSAKSCKVPFVFEYTVSSGGDLCERLADWAMSSTVPGYFKIWSVDLLLASGTSRHVEINKND